MQRASLKLLVLKTRQVEAVRSFYATLGIEFAEEKHGDGPRHYTGRLGETVLELYPLPEGMIDSTTRLGFGVTDLESVLTVLRALQAAIKSEAKATAWGRR